MAYDLIKISALPAATPDESQEIVVGVGDLAKRINYGDVKADMVGTSPSYTTDTEPYLMRRTAHVGVVGKCALNKLVGGSLGWNQLIPTANRNYSNPVTDTRAVFQLYIRQPSSPYTLLLSKPFSTAQSYQTIVSATYSGATIFLHNGNTTNLTLANNINVTAGHKYAFAIKVQGADPTTVGGLITEDMQFVDLTFAFGSTIADYIYNLETATAGAGIAKLKSWGIDLGTYHAYDAGSIQSVQATAHVTKDANDNVIGNYPLGSDTLRGIPQLVNNELQYDGDVKTADGTITRKYKLSNLGSLNWTYGASSKLFSTTLSDAKSGTSKLILSTAKYEYYKLNGDGNDPQKKFYLYNNTLFISDLSFATTADFVASLSNVYLLYELATPTTENGTAYQRIQTVDADGTESFTTSSPVPVGHETQTPDNILAALEWLGE